MAPVTERLLEAIAERDFDAIAECFSADATLQAIVPAGLRHDEGREAIEDRYRLWLGDAGEYSLLECETTAVSDVVRLRYAVRSSEPGEAATVFEQTAYVELEEDEIVNARIACSGRRASEAVPATPA
jgi:hypothetical protein